MLTLDIVKNQLDYDKQTGLFTWNNVSKYHSEKNGREAGALCDGYVKISISGKKYSAHRLAWLYTYGYLPEQIDHINGISNDNRIDNLRECTHAENVRNHGKTIDKSGLPTGVRFMNDGYQARVTYNGKQYHLGVYKTPQEAEDIYLQTRKILFGEYHRDNTRCGTG
jgi:hypothetical protein